MNLEKVDNFFPKGRLRRSYFILIEILSFIVVLLCMGAIMDTRHEGNEILNGVIWAVFIGLFIVQLIILSKRLRDCGFMAIFSLFALIPMLNGALILLLCFYPGQKGENKFGPDPREKDNLNEQN